MITIETYLEAVEDLGHPVLPTSKILDFGCGAGETVQNFIEKGHDAYGCDLKFKDGDNTDHLAEIKKIRIISLEPYHLPFEDNTFDFIFSNQVFEHVQNYDETIAELHRVLKPGGLCLHIFPSKYKPWESHVLMPLASLLQHKEWLYFWYCLGVGKKVKGKSKTELSEHYETYLRTRTNYLDDQEIRVAFGKKFKRFQYAEQSILKSTEHARAKKLYRLGTKIPFIFWIYRVFWSRTIAVS